MLSETVNIPNLLTIARIVLTVVFFMFVGQDGFMMKLSAALAFLIASVTDYLDGYLARKYNLVTDFGKIMDPIADKFLMLSAFFIFMRLEFMPGWMFGVVAAREIGITVWRLVRTAQGEVLPAERLGKIKTVFQAIAAYTALFFLVFREVHFYNTASAGTVAVCLNIVYFLMWLAFVLTVVSGLQYFIRWRR